MDKVVLLDHTGFSVEAEDNGKGTTVAVTTDWKGLLELLRGRPDACGYDSRSVADAVASDVDRPTDSELDVDNIDVVMVGILDIRLAGTLQVGTYDVPSHALGKIAGTPSMVAVISWHTERFSLG